MDLLKTSALCLALLGLTGGGAIAQNTMTKGAMAKPMMEKPMMEKPMMEKPMMAKPMSAKDTKMMKSCQAMSHGKMMRNRGCKKMMKMHPGMSSDSMMKH